MDAEVDEGDFGTCHDGFPRGRSGLGLVAHSDYTPSPEGVAVCPSGEIFVSLWASGEIWRVSADLTQSSIYTILPGRSIGGLTCDDQGRLFAATTPPWGETTPAAVCMRIDFEGHEGLALPHEIDDITLDSPNGIAFVPGAGIYMSDSAQGLVVRFVETSADTYEATIVGRDDALGSGSIGANGLAYSGTTNTLYVAVTATGAIQAFELEADGALSPSPTEVFKAAGHLADGVAVDEEGTLYLASFGANKILRVTGPDTFDVIADSTTDPLFTHPASVAFRGGVLFITSFHLLDTARAGPLWQLQVGACGAPLEAED